MIDKEAYALAEAFAALKENPAFKSLMEWLHANVLLAEGEAVLAAPSIETRELRNRFIAWQERRKIELAIDDIFDEHARIKTLMDEELANERAIEHERNTRTGW